MSAEVSPSGPSVRCTVDGEVLIATIANPPVNALGQEVRAGLLEAVARLESDAALRAMLLCADGPLFIGGADIREFAGPRLEPLLSSVCDRLEACDKPIVAVMQGAALGGGFEVALAAHYRVASPGAEYAFPEITLGLLPGAGGTQRAPRLCGAACALDLMLGATRLSAQRALDVGLVDQVHFDPFAAAMQWVRTLLAQGGAVRRARHGRALEDRVASLDAVRQRRAALSGTSPFAATRILACVQRAIECTPDEGLAFERAAFAECLASPERAALVHVFFAERAVRKREVDVAALGRALVAARDVAARDVAARDVAARDAVPAETVIAAVTQAAFDLVNSGVADADACDVASIHYCGFPRASGGVLWHARYGPPLQQWTDEIA